MKKPNTLGLSPELSNLLELFVKLSINYADKKIYSSTKVFHGGTIKKGELTRNAKNRLRIASEDEQPQTSSDI